MLKILTRFNFHISAGVIDIICNYSLVSLDPPVKNDLKKDGDN